MSNDRIDNAFRDLVGEFNDVHDLIRDKPLLAHYTSISNIESIMKTGEIWFSNPLFMNDLEEMRFGINEGMSIVMQTDRLIGPCGSIPRTELFQSIMQRFHQQFASEHALDVYVFCLSQYSSSNDDGVLSMWRAYGGQGNGAALVLNTGFVKFNAASPMMVSRVRYLDSSSRRAWLESYIVKHLDVMKNLNLPDDQMFIAGYHIFNLIKVFALTFKHSGFAEENEWRVIYMPDRDKNKKLVSSYSYHVGPRGVEPKLKFPIKPLDIPDSGDWKFDDIVEKIVLGPSLSSPLALASVKRMLRSLDRSAFEERIVASSIPLRPI